MANKKYGIDADEEIVQEVDGLAAECDDFGASRSKIVEAILQPSFIRDDPR
jgi:hypothetical protein